MMQWLFHPLFVMADSFGSRVRHAVLDAPFELDELAGGDRYAMTSGKSADPAFDENALDGVKNPA